jgi:integrase
MGLSAIRVSAAHSRASGLLGPDGLVAEEPHPVRTRTVQGDLKWLKWCLGWATTWQDAEGRYLLIENPVRGEGAYPIPVERNPKRPLTSTDRLEAVLAAAQSLEMELRWGGNVVRQRAYLADIITLCAETGRRVSAVLALQWGDVLWDLEEFGSICWRADSDKMGREWVAPLSPAARAVLERLRVERPGIGSAYLFPSPTNPAKPVSYELTRKWLLKAEKVAGVVKQSGGSFHPFRRAWATARKHLPVQDVAYAGGWKSTAVLLNLYQQPDDATLLRVVRGGSELREAR